MGLFNFFKSDNKKPTISQKLSQDSIKSVTEPIDGYKLLNVFNNVIVRRLGIIPEGAEIGSRVALIYEPATKGRYEGVSLLLVPQKKLFGFIDDEKIQNAIINCLKNSDKSVARITYFSRKEYDYESTVNIAFFKKNK